MVINALFSETGSLKFKHWAGQFRKRVANSSPPLRQFFKKSCVVWARFVGYFVWTSDGTVDSLWLLSRSEVKSSRTSLASRTSSRTHFEVLGLEGQVLGLGLEASSPQKLACPRLEDSTIFWNVKILWCAWKIIWKTFFSGDRLKNFCEDLFFFGDRLKNFCEDLFFFFWRALALCVLGPWPRAFLFLASRVSVLGKAVLGLGLGFFLCPWPWPRALCPRLHLWSRSYSVYKNQGLKI